ncbi:MAG: hypothetical protein GY808_17765 [Gammaproteobacteria bacterium]|nr:hypothetical protein [Gammaproteobacteria bacterium]
MSINSIQGNNLTMGMRGPPKANTGPGRRACEPVKSSDLLFSWLLIDQKT